MRRIWCSLLAGTLASVLGACSGNDPGDPDANAAPAASPSQDAGPQIGTWTALAELPQQRSRLSATVLDGQVYVAGGLVQGPGVESGRENLGAAYLDGVVYTAAGRLGGEGVAFEAYDVEAQEWTALPDVPAARSGAAVVAFQGQIYVVGGETLPYRTHDQVERFDPQAGTWQEVTPMPLARHGLGAVALYDGIMAIGGGPTSGSALGSSSSAQTGIWRP